MPTRSQRRVVYRALNQYVPLTEQEEKPEADELTITRTVPQQVLFSYFEVGLTVIGTGFDETCVVHQEGYPAETTFIDDTRLDCNIYLSEGEPTTYVTVVKGDEETDAFTVPVRIPDLPVKPVLTSINPSTVVAGSPDTPSTVIGTGFTADGHVTVGGAIVASTFISDTQMDYTLPALWISAPSTVYVGVQGEAYCENPLPVTVEAAAAAEVTLTSYSPDPIPAGLATGVTVTGTGFDATCEFYLDGQPSDPSWVVIDSATQATITAPSWWVAGNYMLMAYSDTLGANSNELPVTVEAAAASLALVALNPDTINTNAGTAAILVAGTGFISGQSAVNTDGTPRSTLFLNSELVRFTISVDESMADTTTTVYVSNAGGPNSNGLPLTIEPAPLVPTVTATDPTILMVGSVDTPFTVTGTDFDAACAIQLQGASQPSTLLSDTELTCTFPASLAAVAGDIYVQVLKEYVGTSNQLVVKVGVAALTSIDPVSGVIDGPNVTLHCHGHGFTEGSTITVNSMWVTTTFVSANELTTVIDMSSIYQVPGPVPVSVVNLDETETNSLTFTFTS